MYGFDRHSFISALRSACHSCQHDCYNYGCDGCQYYSDDVRDLDSCFYSMLADKMLERGVTYSSFSPLNNNNGASR